MNGKTAPSIFDDDIPRRSEISVIYRNFIKNKGAVLSCFVLLIIILMAIFAPFVAPYDPLGQEGMILSKPTKVNLFGTDTLGRDMFSRIIFGARISLSVGFGSVIISLLIGMVLGLLGGFIGGKVDAVIVMIVDVFMSFPGLLLAMVIASTLKPTTMNVMIAVGIGEFTMFARVVRSATLVEKNKGYVLASHSIGSSQPWIILKHIIPNIMPQVIVLATVNIGSAILSAASLGFLGLGAQPPTPEWGYMVNVGRDFMQFAPWLTVAPGVSIMVTVLAANIFGDGLSDALDPRLRK